MDLFQSIAGRIDVEITGADITKTLKAVSDADIPCYHTRQTGEMTATLTIPRRKYTHLKKICDKHGDTLRSGKKSGIYWNFRAFTMRPVLILGAVLILTAICYLPSRVFFVEVEGNTRIPARQIVAAAEDCGIRFGASRWAVRSERIKNSLLGALPELQWAGVNTYGCVAKISVRERSVPEESRIPSGYGNIVALCDGVVTSCTATGGNLLCKPGQAVTKGEVLISGYTDCGICIRLTQAQGEVYAETLRSVTVVCPGIYRQKTDISDVKRKISLLIGKKRINLWKDSGISDATCGRMYEEYYITLPGGFRLPLGIGVDAYTPWSAEEAEITAEQAEPLLNGFGESYLREQMVAGVIRSRNTSVLETKDCWLLEGEYVCVEMIGAMQREQMGEEHE